MREHLELTHRVLEYEQNLLKKALRVKMTPARSLRALCGRPPSRLLIRTKDHLAYQSGINYIFLFVNERKRHVKLHPHRFYDEM